MCISCVAVKSIKRLNECIEHYECDEIHELLLSKLIEFELEHNGMDYDTELVTLIRMNAEVKECSIQDVVNEVIDGKDLMTKEEIERKLNEE